jgi:hypothetical protein
MAITTTIKAAADCVIAATQERRLRQLMGQWLEYDPSTGVHNALDREALQHRVTKLLSAVNPEGVTRTFVHDVMATVAAQVALEPTVLLPYITEPIDYLVDRTS